MKYAQKSISEFVDDTFSKAPVPGGGGVSAAVGALGAALGGMVCSLTSGKKKYAAYEEDIQRISGQLKEASDSFLGMIDKDAENFLPLSKAYGLPASTEEEKSAKDAVMQEALKTACSVPLEIVKTGHKIIPLFEELIEKGSALALSDVGVGATLLSSAIQGGWLNVVININMIKDEGYIQTVRTDVEPLVSGAVKKLQIIYENVCKTLEKE